MIIQKEFNDDDGCNKCPTPQISHWHNELCENDANPPMRNKEACQCTKGGCEQSKNLGPRISQKRT